MPFFVSIRFVLFCFASDADADADGDADTAVLLLEEMPTTADIVKNIRVMQITAAATTIVVFLPFVGFLVLLGVVAAGCLLATSSPCSTSPASSTCCDALLVIVLSALE